MSPGVRADGAEGAGTATIVRELDPFDATEARHRDDVLAWVASGAPLHRTAKPATPPQHLVSYVVVLDPAAEAVLLVAHRSAGLLLPPGGHVEVGESPAGAARRELEEELGLQAPFWAVSGPRPFFLTVSRTRGEGSHTDVSLWFVVEVASDVTLTLDEREASSCRWFTLDEVLAHDPDQLDPHLPRFVRKVRAALGQPRW